jgi:heme-degrading monooxygenase HmoA
MVIREWRGRAGAENQDAYPAHFRDHVLPGLRRVPGFAGASLARRILDGGKIEFLVLTRWHSMDAVRAFAGDDPTQAVVEPGAAAALTDFDKAVRHYELIEEA